MHYYGKEKKCLIKLIFCWLQTLIVFRLMYFDLPKKCLNKHSQTATCLKNEGIHPVGIFQVAETNYEIRVVY